MFKFSENILKLSLNSNIDEAVKEWSLIDEGKTEEAVNTCICQKRIKHFSYMYNSKTKKTILVGIRCYKKFNFNDAGIKNRLPRQVLQSSVRSGHYVILDLEYSETIAKKLIYLTKNRDSTNASIDQ